MQNYAVVTTDTGVVENMTVWDGATDWLPPEGYTAVQTDSAGIGWSYADGIFSSPPLPPAIPPTSAETMAANTVVRDGLLAIATLAIAPLQDAIDLDDASPAETTALKLWKQYRVAVSRADLTLAAPAWPVAPTA